MRAVFVDTNAFRKEGYRTDGVALKALLSLARSSVVQVLLPDIIVQENHAQLREIVDSSKTAVNRLRKAGGTVLRLLPDRPFGTLFAIKDWSAVASQACTLFDDYVRKLKPIKLRVAAVDPSAVFERYFAVSPPFGKGDKKAEFPDAFAASMLSSWARRNDDHKVAIVSDDSDWKLVCDGEPLFDYFDTLDAFIDDVYAKSERARSGALRKFLKGSAAEVALWSAQTIMGYSSYLFDEDGEVEINKVSPKGLPRISILAVGNDVGLAKMTMPFEIEGEAAWVDPDQSVWDQEEDRWLFEETLTQCRTWVIEVEVFVEVVVKSYKKKAFELRDGSLEVVLPYGLALENSVPCED